MLLLAHQNPRALEPCAQMLLLAHLYAKTDSASLAALRAALLRRRFTSAEVTVGVGLGVTATAGAKLQRSAMGAKVLPAAAHCGTPSRCLRAWSLPRSTLPVA